MFKTKEEVIGALSELPAGESRRRFLDETNAADFLTAIGSNVTLYHGKPTTGKTFSEQLAPVSIVVIERRLPNGERDGIGALGGLSECIESADYNRLSDAEKRQLVGIWDNVVLQNNQPTLITDKKTISVNNVKRELSEELGNIGISNIVLPWEKMKRLPFEPYDSDFLIHRWEKGNRVSIVRPQCYGMEIPEQTADYLIAKSNQGIRQTDTELFGLQKIPLIEAMKRGGQSKDKDYRYPHEWLSSWFLAAQMVQGREARDELVTALNAHPYFKQACQQMNLSPELINRSLTHPIMAQRMMNNQHCIG